MLPYKLSSNTQTILTLSDLVSAKLAKYFWNASFQSKYFSNIVIPIGYGWEIDLKMHCKETIRLSNDFMIENKLPSLFKTILKDYIYLLYQAYYQMLLWKTTYDPENKIDLLRKDELHAPNYFTIDGTFSDFIWVKQFVNNSNYDIHRRFYLACFYWFENETDLLWTQMKQSYLAPFAGNIFSIVDKVDPLIILMIFMLENNLQVLAQNRDYEGNFWEVGFKKSAVKGYEYATYYFWQHLSEAQKISLIENNCLFELLKKFVEYPKSKINNFLYSKLSNKQKQDLLDWTICNNRPGIWLTLIHSPYRKILHSEIIEFIRKLPIETYSKLLEELANSIYETGLLCDIKMFNILWSNLTIEEKHITLKTKSITHNLVYEESFTNLNYIIKDLSLKQKDECLFYGMYGSWYCLTVIGKYKPELLQKFLSFFLLEFDQVTQKESLRKDIHLFLENFVKPDCFKVRPWFGEKISKVDEEKVKNVMSMFQTSQTLLDELCYIVCEDINGM